MMNCLHWQRLSSKPLAERLGHVVCLLEEIVQTTKDADEKESIEDLARQMWGLIDRLQNERFPVVKISEYS